MRFPCLVLVLILLVPAGRCGRGPWWPTGSARSEWGARVYGSSRSKSPIATARTWSASGNVRLPA
jgi:hypothetical protein